MNLQINTGLVTIDIERDGTDVGSISFNPTDVTFAENLYALFEKLEAKEKEYKAKEEQLKASAELDEYGFPKNIKEQMELYRTSCEFIRNEIDIIFGKNTSDIVFGRANSFEIFEQFLNGITPYIQSARDKKLSKYLNHKQNKTAGLK